MIKKRFMIAIGFFLIPAVCYAAGFPVTILSPEGGEHMHIGDTLTIKLYADSSCIMDSTCSDEFFVINASLDSGKTYMTLVHVHEEMEPTAFQGHSFTSVHREAVSGGEVMTLGWVIPDSFTTNTGERITSLSQNAILEVHEYVNPSSDEIFQMTIPFTISASSAIRNSLIGGIMKRSLFSPNGMTTDCMGRVMRSKGGSKWSIMATPSGTTLQVERSRTSHHSENGSRH